MNEVTVLSDLEVIAGICWDTNRNFPVFPGKGVPSEDTMEDIWLIRDLKNETKRISKKDREIIMEGITLLSSAGIEFYDVGIAHCTGEWLPEEKRDEVKIEEIREVVDAPTPKVKAEAVAAALGGIILVIGVALAGAVMLSLMALGHEDPVCFVCLRDGTRIEVHRWWDDF